MSHRLQFRRDTHENWIKYNPVLMEGEPAFEIDTHRMKVGDGIHAYLELEYEIGIGNISNELGGSETIASSQKFVTELYNSGYKYIGIIKPNEKPISLIGWEKIFYAAVEEGVYHPDFGQLDVISELSFFKSDNGRWQCDKLGIKFNSVNNNSENSSIPRFDGFIDGVISIKKESVVSGKIKYSTYHNKFVCELNSEYYQNWKTYEDYMTVGESSRPIPNRLFEYNKQQYIYNGDNLLLIFPGGSGGDSSINVVQTLGQSTRDVISQKVVTNEFRKITEYPDWGANFIPDIQEINISTNVRFSWNITINKNQVDINKLTLFKDGVEMFTENNCDNNGYYEFVSDGKHDTIIKLVAEINEITFSKVFTYSCVNPIYIGFTESIEQLNNIKENALITLLYPGKYEGLELTCPADNLILYIAIPEKMQQKPCSLKNFSSNGISIPLNESEWVIYNNVNYRLYLSEYKIISGIISNINLLTN